jgi:hypothetical protein
VAPPRTEAIPARRGGPAARPARLTAVRAFALAFALLVGAAAAVAVAQFRASSLAAWVSLGCSAAAALLGVASMFARMDR